MVRGLYRLLLFVRGLTASSRIAPRRQYVQVELAARRVRIGFQPDGGHAPIAAVERGVFDPLAQKTIVPQLAPYAQAEIASMGIVKSGRLAARAAVSVNEAQLFSAHLPRLLDDGGHRQADEVGGAIAVQIDLREERGHGIC